MAAPNLLTRQCDVLIVGAGPAGAASATLLARQGLDVVAIDRAEFPREKPCSEYMSPEAARILDELGVIAKLRAAGAVPVEGTDVHAARGSVLKGRFAHAHIAPPRPAGLAIARRLLDATLVDAARDAGATVHERTTLSALLQDGHGAVQGAVIRQDGRDTEIRARVVIGADGLRSRVARTIGERKHGWLRRTAFVAHVADVPGLHRSAEMHVSGRGYVGLNPIGGGIANVALLMPASIAKQAAGRVEDFFFEQLDAIPGVRGRVRREAVVREILVTGPFAATSTRVTTDGCMLIGDAADFFDPFTGEGICTALRGAELAARHLPTALDGTATATQRALAGYRADRRRLFAGKWAVERLIGWSMQWPALFDHAVGRLQRRGMAHTLVGVTADFVPARAVLNPLFLARMLF